MMTHTYKISGMTCSGCEAKVKGSLLKMPDVLSADVSKEKGTATITMGKLISLSALQEAIGGINSKYQVSAEQHSEMLEQTKSWFEIYKPILLIFSYITIVTVLIQFEKEHFNGMQWMQHFMAGFFLIFSFFKLLNLSGFAESYAMYDVVAMKFKQWGYIYAFLEFSLGLAYLTNYRPYITSVVMLVVMSISIIGVLKSVLNKQKIQCACLGAVFNLPMSTVTILEDALMIGMSASMLILMK
jgi:copper chaperone CopZ